MASPGAPRLGRRLAWFVGLWAVGVFLVGAVAFALRALIGA